MAEYKLRIKDTPKWYTVESISASVASEFLAYKLECNAPIIIEVENIGFFKVYFIEDEHWATEWHGQIE